MLSRCVFFLLAALALRADSITYTTSFNTFVLSPNGPGIAPCLFPISFPHTCQLTVLVPQSPDAQSATFKLLETQRVYWGFNDVGDPSGLPWSFTFHDEVSGLGQSATNDTIQAGTTIGSSQIDGGRLFYNDSFDLTGAITDLTPFLGTGMVAVTFAATASNTPGCDLHFNPVNYSVCAATAGIGNAGTLSITYNPVGEVPEPKWEWLLVSLIPLLRRRIKCTRVL
jgi:hypothetical protein